MARAVGKNHNVGEAVESDAALEAMAGLDTLEAPNAEEAVSEAAEAAKVEAVEAAKGESVETANGECLILKGAATYAGRGLRFQKNVPTAVADAALRDSLLQTGLFVRA